MSVAVAVGVHPLHVEDAAAGGLRQPLSTPAAHLPQARLAGSRAARAGAPLGALERLGVASSSRPARARRPARGCASPFRRPRPERPAGRDSSPAAGVNVSS